MPAVNTAQRSPQSINPMRRHAPPRRCSSSRSTSWLVASVGSGLMPRARAKTLAAPPGTTPTAGPFSAGWPLTQSPRMPLTTSFTVPSPPCTITASIPSRAASLAISMAWPRWSVCATVRLTRLSSACASRSRPAGVVEVAFGLTISTARTGQKPIQARPTGTLTLAVVIVPAPATVRQAGVVVALEGAALAVVAVVLVVRAIGGAHEKAISGYGTAAWYSVMGAGVIAAGWALWTGRRLGRGVAVFAQLLLLPVAWYIAVGSQRWAYGVPLALVAVGALVLLFSPSALQWASATAQDPASADNSGPDTR